MTFWLGLPGLLFILWCWHDSLSHQAGIVRPVWVSTPDESIGLDDTISYRMAAFEVTVHRIDPAPDRRVSTFPIDLGRHDLFPGLRALRRTSPRFYWGNPPEPFLARPGLHARGFIMPFWLLLLIYGGSWGCAFLWRARRQRRAMRASLTEPSA